MSDQACCAHRHIVSLTVHDGGLSSDRWECRDCRTEFRPFFPGEPKVKVYGPGFDESIPGLSDGSAPSEPCGYTWNLGSPGQQDQLVMCSEDAEHRGPHYYRVKEGDSAVGPETTGLSEAQMAEFSESIREAGAIKRSAPDVTPDANESLLRRAFDLIQLAGMTRPSPFTRGEMLRLDQWMQDYAKRDPVVGSATPDDGLLAMAATVIDRFVGHTCISGDDTLCINCSWLKRYRLRKAAVSQPSESKSVLKRKAAQSGESDPFDSQPSDRMDA